MQASVSTVGNPAFSRQHTNSMCVDIGTHRHQLSDKVLEISSLNHTVDDGNYSCAAQNEAGRGDFSAKFHLLVNYKPVVSVVTPDPVVEQHPVTITCQSQEARPAVTSVMWKKGQEVISVTTDNKYTGGTVQAPSLTIGSVFKTDAGEYSVNWAMTWDIDTALLIQYFKTGEVSADKPYGQATVAPEDVTVAVGGQVSLTCRAPNESGHPTATWFTWSKDNSNFSSNTTDSLRLTPTEVTESGKYRCKAGNFIGQSDHSDWTTVTVQASARVEYPRTENIQHSPAFDIADFNMTCTVSGSGDPAVQWQKDGVSVDIGDFTVTSVQVTGGQYSYGQTESKESTLMWQVTKRVRYFTCSNITHFDGNYTCAVSTQTAGAMTRDESKAFIVSVQYEAHWSSGPTLTAAAPNDTSKEIVCSVCANPQPTLLWTFKNESLRKGIQVVGNKIILDHVTRDDFGVYQCMANNTVNGEDRMAVFAINLMESEMYTIFLQLEKLDGERKHGLNEASADFSSRFGIEAALFRRLGCALTSGITDAFVACDGLPRERREAGVGFAIKTDIIRKLTEMPRPVSDRIVMTRLPLSMDNFATINSVYAPTMTNPDENKEAFYNQLSSVFSGIPRTDKLLLIGDFNARIGRDNDKWPLVMGKLGIGKCNSNGELLLALCSEFELIVMNTIFKQKDEHKTTWMRPRTRHWHMIDFIITRCRDKMDISSTRVMRGANCWTYQRMRRSNVAFSIRQKHNRQRTNKPTKLNAAKLSTISHRESFEHEMDSALAQWEEKESSAPDEEWAALQ
ncbi:hypothetical protein NP493_561g01052 [Ridgeia piscesae]|uniref:Ig-like domain-containing protein n=1 Tax=Ridgeia piscesae TaxID=27915 RepID=A0AAD9NPM4_RIDPI|nr:hypothetical protein NP493_561g01052 [Ridgeia piscesae]